MSRRAEPFRTQRTRFTRSARRSYRRRSRAPSLVEDACSPDAFELQLPKQTPTFHSHSHVSNPPRRRCSPEPPFVARRCEPRVAKPPRGFARTATVTPTATRKTSRSTDTSGPPTRAQPGRTASPWRRRNPVPGSPRFWTSSATPSTRASPRTRLTAMTCP